MSLRSPKGPALRLRFHQWALLLGQGEESALVLFLLPKALHSLARGPFLSRPSIQLETG